MTVVVLDDLLAERLLRERQASGGDHHDEVWDGVYMMSPLPNNEHQQIVSRLNTILDLTIGIPGLGEVSPGVNVSDQDEDWTHNYRCPDVVVFLHDGKAVNHGTYWLGGPDFAVEIVGENDRARDKVPFYEKVGVRELFLVDRDPWALELLRLEDGRLASVGRSTLERPDVLASAIVPLTFRLVAGAARPAIEVAHRDGQQRWTV